MNVLFYKNLKYKGCLVEFDNFFTTKCLMKTVLKDNIFSFDRVNRKGFPPMLKTNDKLCRGEFMFDTQQEVWTTDLYKLRFLRKKQHQSEQGWLTMFFVLPSCKFRNTTG